MSASIKEIIASYDPKRSPPEASTPPAAWYTDRQIYQLELRTVLSNSWQVVGRANQLSAPGRFVTTEVGGEPILVVAGNDGILRGFYNVCRHHAAAVVTACEGTAANLCCPYHGWTYDLEGRLVLTPEFSGVERFDRAANGLVPVPIAVWNNWVFAKLAPGEPSLEDFLGEDLLRSFELLRVNQLRWSERRVYDLDCNWKVFVDNYLDGGYHVPRIHGSLNSVLDYSNYTVETGARFCLQSSPISHNPPDRETAAVRRGNRALYYWVYPNFMINLYDGVMDTNIVIARGVARTEVVFDYYFADTLDPSREQNLASIAVSEQVQAEDRAICESVQRGLNSRAYDTGRLSVRREAGEHLFHKLLYTDLQTGI